MSQDGTKRKSRRAQQRQRAQIQLFVGIAIVVVAGVLAVIFLPKKDGGNTQIDTDYSSYTQSIDTSQTGIGLSLGNPDAPVTFVEFSDFSCPHCRNLAGIVHQLIEDYVGSGELRVVYKPVSFVNPPYSTPAALAAYCAAEQGQGWEMHDYIWSIYDNFGTGGYTQSVLSDRAETLGLNKSDFIACYRSNEASAAVQSVINETQALGISGTPYVFINGEIVPYRGEDVAYADFTAYIDELLGK